MRAATLKLEHGLDDHDSPRSVAVRRSGPSAGRTGVALLRLSLGLPVDARELAAVDWAVLLSMALRERLGGVAWLRSGALIRSAAPTDVVNRWRTLAVVMDQRGRERLDSLARTIEALSAAGVRPVVLKGMPLSMRLYGDPFVRASDDIDLFVKPNDRRRTREIVSGCGWTHVEGNAPWDELFTRGQRSRLYLEVHEGLVTDYLAHVPMPAPVSTRVTLGSTTVDALGGPAEPAYLAAHLAGHQLPPLLWILDFLTLWSGLDGNARRAAHAEANHVGLGRYLRWAVSLAETLSAAAGGTPAAVERLGVGSAPRHDTHFSVIRHARLAAHPLDAIRVVAACVWPRPIRWDVSAFAARVRLGMLHRTVRRTDSLRAREEEVLRVASGKPTEADNLKGGAGADLRDSVAGERTVGAEADLTVPSGRLNLDRPEVLLVVREVIGVAGTARVRAAGMSMWPTIGNGSLVALAPVPERLRIGQIVLMDWGGRPVLHRIVRLDSATVYTAGDACLEPDPPTSRDRICAVATSVSDGRGVVTLTGSWSLGLRSWLLYAALRSRLGLARAWRRLRHSRRR